MAVIMVADSGTTNTRVRLWDGRRVIASASEPVGARNTAIDGHNGRVKEALRRLIEQLEGKSEVRPEAVVCSGMITSNVGLVEVPHLPAPAGISDLADHVVRIVFPDISPLPFYLIPGVKSLPEPISGETLPEADILRGEEVEVAGLRELLGISGPSLLMHFGSHHKAISVDAGGRILWSRTSITGELLMAIASNTILKSSMIDLGQLPYPDPEMVRAGIRHALEHGVGRCLFLGRVADVLWGRDRCDVTSFILGCLATLDLPLLAGARETGAQVVLYGKGHFPPILRDYLNAEGWENVHLVDVETADLSAVIGAVRVFERVAH
ncbi:MAG: 2-dehydro-3-deoxygalactonokinase [Symbiobacterium sp.]|uniref:2-dehydro-3-deoxygalactonokinase n=1 Tax=Symbiobacterium sp. TaxID=1971213 RepID=UPI003464CE7C